MWSFHLVLQNSTSFIEVGTMTISTAILISRMATTCYVAYILASCL